MREWLTVRSLPVRDIRDEKGQECIESWITDTGPRAELPFGIRDIQLRFYFDHIGRLTSFTAKVEERF